MSVLVHFYATVERMKTRNDIDIALNTRRRIPPEALKALYDTEPWWPERTTEDLECVLHHFPAVGAWRGQELVGFARAVTDSRFRAYIEDVLVKLEYRSAGIGERLMQTLVEELQHIHVITLFCRPRASEFYTRLGFKEFTKQIVMHLRNRR